MEGSQATKLQLHQLPTASYRTLVVRRLACGQLDRMVTDCLARGPAVEQFLMMNTRRVGLQPRSIVYRRSVVQASGSPMVDGMGGKGQACRGHGWC